MSAYDAAYAKRWHIDKARGLHRTTTPHRAVVQIELLRRAGCSYAGIGHAIGLSDQAIGEIHRGGRKRVKTSTESALLELTPAKVLTGPQALVPATGAIRRVRALLAIGWPTLEQEQRTGVDLAHIGAHAFIPWAKDAAVRKLYAELSMTPGPSKYARAQARRLGYAPPLAWDDTIDDPDAQPNLGELVPVKDPRQSEHTAAEAQFLLSCGVSLDQAARQLGVTRKYLTDTLPGRLGRREAS